MRPATAQLTLRWSARLYHGFARIPRSFHSTQSPIRAIHGSTERQQPRGGRDGKMPSRIVFGSCASQREQEKRRLLAGNANYSECCWQALQDGPYPPDLVILMGDNVYADEFDSIEEAYHELTSNKSFCALQERCQVIATMDDNDYTDDLERGKLAFLDQLVCAAPNDVRRRRGRGIYDSYNWRRRQLHRLDTNNPSGADNNITKDQFIKDQTTNLALQVILLDVRYRATPDDLLGETQWQWLSDQLEHYQQPKADCDSVQLRVIVSPIQILPTSHRWECWNMIPKSRRRLLDMIANCPSTSTTTTTILLSGDRHVATMYQDGDALLEVTSSSLTHTVRQCSSRSLNNEYDPHYQLEPYVYENNFGEISIDWTNRNAYVSIRSVATRETLQSRTVSF